MLKYLATTAAGLAAATAAQATVPPEGVVTAVYNTQTQRYCVRPSIAGATDVAEPLL